MFMQIALKVWWSCICFRKKPSFHPPFLPVCFWFLSTLYIAELQWHHMDRNELILVFIFPVWGICTWTTFFTLWLEWKFFWDFWLLYKQKERKTWREKREGDFYFCYFTREVHHLSLRKNWCHKDAAGILWAQQPLLFTSVSRAGAPFVHYLTLQNRSSL